MFLYWLTILVVSATVSYIANLGLLSTFRHHYMVDLEHRLSSNFLEATEPILHWETISKPVITMNPKHTGTGIFSLFSINAHIALGSIMILALFFVIMQMVIILNTFPQLSTITWCGLILYVLILLICAITLVVSMYKSKDLYQQALKKTKYPLSNPLYPKRSIIFYYLYPRIKDIQKILFIVIGYVTGYTLSALDGTATLSLWKNIPDLLVTLFILDTLVYQARYLWNDIRGAYEDYRHPSAKTRMRLPTDTLSFRPAVYIALIVMGLRLIAAFFCISLLNPSKQLPLTTSCILILALGGAYEAARTNNKPKWTIFLVCLGYPLRWGAGLWSAYPNLIYLTWQKPTLFWSILLLLISIGAFGGAFVSMTWVLEAVHIYQKKKEINKPHLQLLLNSPIKEQNCIVAQN